MSDFLDFPIHPALFKADVGRDFSLRVGLCMQLPDEFIGLGSEGGVHLTLGPFVIAELGMEDLGVLEGLDILD